jgi:hypothetical protein
MDSQERPPHTLEPVVAHGARMSWAGILRPDDPLPPGLRSRRAILSSETRAPVERFYGAWSPRYRRFVSNLGPIPRVVRPVGLQSPAEPGVECLIHWLDRVHVLGTGSGTLCRADGWPPELWEALTAALAQHPGRTIAGRLLSLALGPRGRETPLVSAWRAAVRGDGPDGLPSPLGPGWIPVPVRWAAREEDEAAILSWSPSPARFGSLTEALASTEGLRREPDLPSQARYYIECRLGRLHGVKFGPYDRLEDPEFERSPFVRGLAPALEALERQCLADPRRGRLDAFG